MDFKLFFICFALSVCFCYGYVERTGPSVHPDFPGKCWDPKTEKPYDLGEVFFVKTDCTQGTCGSAFSIIYHGCGAVSVEGCKEIDRNFDLPYPKCCQQYDCGKGNLIPNY